MTMPMTFGRSGMGSGRLNWTYEDIGTEAVASPRPCSSEGADEGRTYIPAAHVKARKFVQVSAQVPMWRVLRAVLRFSTCS